MTSPLTDAEPFESTTDFFRAKYKARFPGCEGLILHMQDASFPYFIKFESHVYLQDMLDPDNSTKWVETLRAYVEALKEKP